MPPQPQPETLVQSIEHLGSVSTVREPLTDAMIELD